METRAINFVRRALVMNPNFDQGYFFLGRIYQEKGKPDQAKQLYAKAIFINPSHGEALAAMRTLPK
jgi:tetratricopeptide (TPR) repeat protein